MNVTRMQIVAEARLWLGTRYFHQGRERGVSVDCVGLVIGIRRGLGLPFHDNLKYNKYGMGPARVFMEFEPYFEPIHPEHARPGDLLGFQTLQKDYIQHVGILTDVGILHTNDRIGRVVEHAMDRAMKRMAVQGFRFRELLEVG